MTAVTIDGRAEAKRLRVEVKGRVAALKAAGIVPGLAVILAGDDPASAIYVRNKLRVAKRLGIEAEIYRFDGGVKAEAIAETIDTLNADPSVHGILVQLPLPSGIPGDVATALTHRVDPNKDVDGLHPGNLGRLAAGAEGFVACTPLGCLRLIRGTGMELSGKRAVVIGRSTLVGKPMALLLLSAHATVTICHSRTKDLAAIVREADVVVAAVGRAEMVRGDWIKPGAVVIDVGINRDAEGKLVGDVHFEEVAAVAGAISPVPGGVGPMTIASLMDNVCRAAER